MLTITRLFIIIFSLSLFNSASQAEQSSSFFSINYGYSTNDVTMQRADGGTVASLKIDDEGEGYVASAGYLIFNNIGLEAMYYDLGSSSFKVTAKDVIKDDLNSYIVATTGTINRDISGYGLGIVGAVDVDIASYLNMSYYAKVGAHNWERSGSTTLLDNNAAFKSRFYDDGIGAYGSLGVAANFTDNIGLNISYHSMGLSNDVSFGNSSSLTSAGLRFKF